jgi:flagellar hook-basal body complex protein FliE
MNMITTGAINPLDRINNTMAAIQSDMPNDDEKTGPDFFDTLKSSIDGIRDLEMESAQNTYDLAMGYTNDLEGVMIQAAKTSTTIEIATQVVSKAISSYKEILQMQV